MNLNGVLGDARKRIETQQVEPPFDWHPQCALCGRRDYHTHVGLEDHTRALFSAVPRD
jgi:hypothetical protein